MKRYIFFIVVLLIFISGCVTNPIQVVNFEGLTLDQAIAEAAVRIEERIEIGSKMAPLNFNSSSDRFSSYVLDELTANLVDSRKLIVVNRSEIDLIRSEFNFQYSGEVGDESMQELGRMLGAQFIISGSLTDMGGFYRIVIRVLNVQNASVEVQYRANIMNDMVVSALLTGGRTTATAMASGSGQQTRYSNTNAQSSSQQNTQSTQQSTLSSTQQPATRAPTYRIGDTGPAGGFIFYDKGIFSNGWRYLEAAPADFEIMAQWGLNQDYIYEGTYTDVGRGKSNTEFLVSRIKERGELDRAAELCTFLDINGFNDWFLPSFEELNLMYTNLKLKGLGGFSNNFYLSSSIFNAIYTYSVHFRDNSVDYMTQRHAILPVRAVRQF